MSTGATLIRAALDEAYKVTASGRRCGGEDLVRTLRQPHDLVHHGRTHRLVRIPFPELVEGRGQQRIQRPVLGKERDEHPQR